MTTKKDPSVIRPKDLGNNTHIRGLRKLLLFFHNFVDTGKIAINEIGVLRLSRVLLLNPMKAVNLLQVFISYFFLKGRMWGIPPVLILETTTACQLRCPLCMIASNNFNRRNEHMDIDLIEKLLQECGNRICAALLYIVGEPFLHPEIMKIIKLFKEHDIIVKISTNGNYSKDISEEIVRSGLDYIIFGVDGDNQEAYAKYRVGGSLNSLLSNIEKLAETKKALGSKKPFIEARLICMEHNIERIDLVKELLNNYDIDLFTIKKCDIGNEDEFPGAISFIPDSFRRAGPGILRSCDLLWTNFCVLVDGKVVPCCNDDKGEFVFGDTRKDSITSILNSSKFIKLRQLMKDNRMAIPMCAKCRTDCSRYSYNTFKTEKATG